MKVRPLPQARTGTLAIAGHGAVPSCGIVLAGGGRA